MRRYLWPVRFGTAGPPAHKSGWAPACRCLTWQANPGARLARDSKVAHLRKRLEPRAASLQPVVRSVLWMDDWRAVGGASAWHLKRRKVNRVVIPFVAPGKGVPRILYQIFMEGFSAQPDKVHDGIADMRARNPGWDYRFYDAAAAERFIRDFYGPDMLAAYLRIDPVYSAARSDLLRYLLCYAHGGVYLDTKSTATRPLDDVLLADDCFLIGQWKELRDLPAAQSSHPETRHIAGCEYVNWFVVSAPGHPFLRAVIEQVLSNISTYNPFRQGVGRHAVLRLTGPLAYTLAIHPIRSAHPHRYVRFDTDIGFEYSIYGDPFSHRTQFGKHYSTATRPLTIGNPVRRHATEILYGRITPFVERVRNKLARLVR